MVKESSRKCSHCGHNGHNSRTCNGKGCLKLFGVKILKERDEESMRKSSSMGNLEACSQEQHSGDNGYLSDGLIQSKKHKAAHERKKGIPWTEKEHQTFLAGLEKLGKGDWRGISKNFVTTRTPTQVASHAQKYFLRLASTEKKKKRPSLFDMPHKEQAPSAEASPVFLTDKTTKVAPQDHNTSPQSPLKSTVEFPTQVTSAAQAQAVNAFPSQAPLVHPMAAACGVPNFRGVPYMMGTSLPNDRMMPTVSYIPMVNFPGQGHVYMPRCHGNFAPCPPIASHSTDLLLESHFPSSSQAASGASSSAGRDGLELCIAPPQSHDGTNLSSQTSGPIRVI